MMENRKLAAMFGCGGSRGVPVRCRRSTPTTVWVNPVVHHPSFGCSQP